ncbi:SLC13 family permease [Nocardioides jensenii]|uniref:SLC13 family permease n=1 Tax=Nocardioides jensenii TaxID=1843 RepID=UPI001C3F25A6|nr:SLC13 family permease [Nocardioides jensenii]
MPVIVVDLVGVACLVALLAVAFLHPRGRYELLAGVSCTGAVLAVGAVSFTGVGDQVRSLLPVVLFLAAILVVAELCAVEGLFVAVGQRVRRAGRARPRRLVALTFVVASVVTAVLSLDATVVLLTPVIAAAAAGTGAQRAGMHACVRLANSASLLLPVSNLTNLLALPHLDVSFTDWVLLMAPVWIVVILVEYAGVLLVFPEARRRSSFGEPPNRAELLRMPLVPLVTVVAMLAGFAAGSAVDLDPFWVAGAAALVLVAHALSRRATRGLAVVHAAHLPFAVFVLCLGVVVLAVTDSFLGEAVAGLIPSSDGLAAMLLIAALATALANLVNNLPATLLLVPLVAALGPVAVLAALIGLNVGSGLTYTGSLANLLWRRTLRRGGQVADGRLFHLHALAVTPVAVLTATVVLWGWVRVTGLA